MKNYILFFTLLVFFVFSVNSQQKENSNDTYETSKKEITTMMLQQARDWSKGDIEAFMEGYIKSDRLKFIGSGGITYGWNQTLENYKKRYPTKEHTGTLTFNLLDFDQLANDVFLVIGEFHLKRTVSDADGIFSIILKRINGEWKIIADHTS
jgi:ketosteroid isomerase-like protein